MCVVKPISIDYMVDTHGSRLVERRDLESNEEISSFRNLLYDISGKEDRISVPVVWNGTKKRGSETYNPFLRYTSLSSLREFTYRKFILSIC